MNTIRRCTKFTKMDIIEEASNRKALRNVAPQFFAKEIYGKVYM